MKIKICKECVITNLKPNIIIDKNGVCSACKNHKIKKKIFDNKNKKILHSTFKDLILKNTKKNNKYDVVVAVSGGKDSIYQIIELKKITKKILAVCVDFGLRTKIGEENLSLICEKLNVDLLKFSVKKSLLKKLAIFSLKKHGDPDLFNHPLIYNIPPIVANYFKVKTVVYGEDPRVEYSKAKISNRKTLTNLKFDKNYYNNFIIHSKINLTEILDKLKIPNEDKEIFKFQKKLKNTKILFLGNYLKWNSINNFKIAKKFGFKTQLRGEGTFRNYVNVDEDWNRVHHYLKLLKFGYGRCTDHACEEIRNGYISRKKGIALVKKYDRQPLSNYYKKRISNYLNIKIIDLEMNIEKYRNRKIWIYKNKKWMLNFEIK